MAEEKRISAAQEAIAELDRKHAEIVAAQQAAAAQLDELRKSAGQRFLAGDETVMRRIRDIEIEVDIRERALEALGARYAVLQREKRVAMVEGYKATIAQMTALRVQTMEKARAPLAELSRIMGVEYSECCLCSERTHDDPHWLAKLGPRVETWLDPTEVYRDPTSKSAGYQVPLSRQIVVHIAQLEASLHHLENELERETASAAVASR